MPSEDYSHARTGGALKLKGDGGKISKKHKSHKKNRKNPTTTTTTTDENIAATFTVDAQATPQRSDHDRNDPSLPNSCEEEAEESALISRARQHAAQADAEAEATPKTHKTEAEKRYEAARRRRLDDLLKRKGNKTHKERVEELNRYLAGLSEHHDMPRIGPG